MRRTFLLGCLASACAIVALAPAASAAKPERPAKFGLTNLSAYSSGLDNSGKCWIGISVNYVGNPPANARETVVWNNAGSELRVTMDPLQGSNTLAYFLFNPADIQTSTHNSFQVNVTNAKNGHLVLASGTTSPEFSTTAGVCPANDGTSWSWSSQ